MRFAYKDLGEQSEGSTVVVRLRGRAANVILLDGTNFAAYRRRLPFFYHSGGNYLSSPVKLEVPSDDHWYLVVDLGGYAGRVRARVEVIPPDGTGVGGGAAETEEETLAEEPVAR